MVFGVKQIRKNPKGRYYLDYGLLKMPIIGILLRKIAVARFTRTLGTLITSGVPILEGLSITARTSGNAVLEEALMKVRKAIEEGRTIVDPLRESGVFPNMVTQMIGVGEATGAMDAMLQKVADFYEDEVDAATKDMLALLEPVLIAFLGLAVGGIVISLVYATVLADCQDGRLSTKHPGRSSWLENDKPADSAQRRSSSTKGFLIAGTPQRHSRGKGQGNWVRHAIHVR